MQCNPFAAVCVCSVCERLLLLPSRRGAPVWLGDDRKSHMGPRSEGHKGHGVCAQPTTPHVCGPGLSHQTPSTSAVSSCSTCRGLLGRWDLLVPVVGAGAGGGVDPSSLHDPSWGVCPEAGPDYQHTLKSTSFNVKKTHFVIVMKSGRSKAFTSYEKKTLPQRSQ